MQPCTKVNPALACGDQVSNSSRSSCEFVEVKFWIRKTKFQTQVRFPTQTQVSDSTFPPLRSPARIWRRRRRWWSNNDFNSLLFISSLETDIIITHLKSNADHAAELKLISVNIWNVGFWNYSKTRTWTPRSPAGIWRRRRRSLWVRGENMHWASLPYLSSLGSAKVRA